MLIIRIYTGKEKPMVRGAYKALMHLVVVLSFLAVSPVHAQVLTQIPLSDKLIEGFLAARKIIVSASEQVEGDTTTSSARLDLESAAREAGFADFREYDTVADNIILIMSGIDPNSNSFLEPQETIKKDIAEVESDATLSHDDKAELLAELKESLKVAVPIKYRENIEMVRKYYERLDDALK